MYIYFYKNICIKYLCNYIYYDIIVLKNGNFFMTNHILFDILEQALLLNTKVLRK